MSAESTFVGAISSATESQSCWAALNELAQGLVGAKLLTISTFDMSAQLVRRVFTNRPVEYPTSGTKPLRGNTGNWFQTVFEERRTFVANTIEDIAKVLPDHELIASIGCGSVVNLPVVLAGELVATVNLLDVAGHYTPERVAMVEGRIGIAARLCCALAVRFDAARADEAA